MEGSLVLYAPNQEIPQQVAKSVQTGKCVHLVILQSRQSLTTVARQRVNTLSLLDQGH